MAKRPPRATPRPPLTPSTTKQFERDVALAKRRGWDTTKLRAVIELLCSHATLPASLSDHALRGEWKTYRDCHIAPDWVLIYRKTATELILARTGTHADLFGR